MSILTTTQQYLYTHGALLADETDGPAGGGTMNPFNGVTPNWSVFGVEFTQTWQKLLGGAWAVALVFCAFMLIRAGVKVQAAKKGGYSQGVLENTDDLKTWGIGTGIVVGAAMVFGIVAVVLS